MTPERWQQVKNTLASALERPDEKDRATFVATTCGDDTALRREVESLLAQPDGELESVAEVIGVARSGPSNPADAGRKIGNYELVREIGRGGMGTVWLARRADQQFEKLVAIKLLKRGTDTDEVLHRFHAERQILARLAHPNIAILFDAGTTDEGLPYFVMEYIEGTRVTEFVRERNLSVTDRIVLFRKVCAAVQFAHENLVVHRDLKPGNILVTPNGEPKLLDFGIAKLLSLEEGAWEMTIAGRERLTPGYASPEQVRGEPVTTVSDVYSLGVLLYEVLAEQPAHRFGTSNPTQTEILRVVCNQDPVRPSAAAVRPEMRRHLRGDLDTIVLRAMAKERARRYHGAGNLADDLRRYLESRPVRARPDTFTYRASKFLGRNKKSVAAAALIVIALLTGLVVATYEARIAKIERTKAERRFSEVRQIANSLMLELHNAIKNLPGALAARQLVTTRALEYLDGLAQEAGNDLSLKSELATAYGKIGLVTFDVRQAIESHRKAATLNEELVKAAPRNNAYREQLSESYARLSDVLKISGQSTPAIDYARKSLAISEALAAEQPRDNAARARLADGYLALGLILLDSGDYQQALQNNLKAREIQERIVNFEPANREALRDLGGIYGALSNVYEETGDYSAASEYGTKETKIAEGFFKTDPSNARSRRDMWAAFFRNARLLAHSSKREDALENYRKAIELIESLAAADPNDVGHRRWLAVTYLDFADLLATINRNDEALANYSKAIAIAEQLVATDPVRVEAQRDLVRMYESLGLFYAKLQERDHALHALEQAKTTAELSANHDLQNVRIQNRLAKISTELNTLRRERAPR
ncbi:MAG: protein kinase [Chthoniobacterales bacterium]